MRRSRTQPIGVVFSMSLNSPVSLLALTHDAWHRSSSAMTSPRCSRA